MRKDREKEKFKKRENESITHLKIKLSSNY